MHEEHGSWTSLGLLLARLGAGGMMLFGHGWAKLSGFSDISSRFPDPLGLGSPAMSLGLAVFAEVFCSAAVAVGLATRLAAATLAVTMLVAAFLVHAGDPFSDREPALLYALPFLVLVLTGPGKFSIDASTRWRFGR